MPSVGTAFVDIRGNFGPLRTGLRRSQYEVQQGLGKMESRATQTFKNIAKIAAVGIGAGAVVGTKKAVQSAVDLGEQINKTEVVFRGSEDRIIQWSEKTADAFGISRREALAATGTFGNMLVPMGFARKEAGEMSTRMVELAADMASFNNASPEETLLALRAGLAGETEPLRRYGVFLNDARLKQEALNLGLKDAVGPTGTLTANAKAQATYSVILKDTRDAQGDFARTSDSLANQQRILKAQFDNAAASLGTALLPALTKGAGALSGFVSDLNKVLSDDKLTGEQKFNRIAEMIGDTVAEGLERSVELAGRFGPRIASELVQGIARAPALAQLAVALFAARKLGPLLFASRAAGAQAGGAFTQGMSTTVAQPGRWAGARAGLIGIGKTVIGASLLSGAAQSFAQGGDFQERIRNFASGATFGLAPNLDKDAKRAEDVERLVRGIGRARADQLPKIRELADVEARILGFNRQQKAAIEAAINARGREQAGGALAGIGEQLREAGRITPALINQISAQLEDLPAKTRPKFAQAVLDWARELKKQGKIKGSLQELKNVIEAEVTGVGRLSLRGPSRLRERIASGFEAMVEAAADPTSRMAQIVSNYLDAFGAAGIGKIQGAIARDKATRAKGHRGGLAQGGFLQGQGKRDTIPIMAAPGEAVLNRHQQQPVETALRTTYGFGLSDLFRKEKRPHYMAKGGFTTPNARLGGSQAVTGDTDVVASLLRALQQLARSTGRSIFIQSGRRTIGEQEALYQKYAGSRPVARPSPNAPHVRGIAADITPGSEVFGNKAGRYGLGFPVAGEPWHIQLVDASRADGGARGAGGALPDVPQLGRVEITGRESVVKDLAQAAVDKTRRAAQRFLDRTGPTAGPTKGGGSVSANRKLGRQMSRAIFGDSQWDALSELWTRESGWSHTAENPSSGAYGIPQALPASKMASAGRDWKTNAATQIRWGLSYIKGRYGSPSAALSFHDAHNWYAKGGFVDEIIREGGGRPERELRAKPPEGLKPPPKGGKKGKSKLPKGNKKKGKARKRYASLPEIDKDSGFLKLLGPLEDELHRLIPSAQERIQSLEDSFSLSDEEFYPDQRVIARLRREGHNIQQLGDQFIDWSAVAQRKSELTTLLGEQFGLIGTPFGMGKGLMEAVRDKLDPLRDQLNTLIAQFTTEINDLKRQVRDNMRKHSRNEKLIETLDERIDKEQGRKKPDRKKIRAWREEKSAVTEENENLRRANRRLTGESQPSGDLESIDGGELGRRLSVRESARESLKEVATDKEGLVGFSGVGGDFASAKNAIAERLKEMEGLSTERITEAVSPSPQQQAQDQTTFLRALGDLQKQFGFNFRNLPSFAGGGRVEAPIGAPVNATVHGGELIVDPRTGALSVKVVGGIQPSKTINVVNNYQSQPEDPHVWSRNVRHELEAAI